MKSIQEDDRITLGQREMLAVKVGWHKPSIDYVDGGPKLGASIDVSRPDLEILGPAERLQYRRLAELGLHASEGADDEARHQLEGPFLRDEPEDLLIISVNTCDPGRIEGPEQPTVGTSYHRPNRSRRRLVCSIRSLSSSIRTNSRRR